MPFPSGKTRPLQQTGRARCFWVVNPAHLICVGGDRVSAVIMERHPESFRCVCFVSQIIRIPSKTRLVDEVAATCCARVMASVWQPVMVVSVSVIGISLWCVVMLCCGWQGLQLADVLLPAKRLSMRWNQKLFLLF